MCLSIRWRLALWNTLALAVVLACFACVVYWLFRRALLEQTDRLLQAALGQLRSDPRAEAAPDERLRYWIKEYKDHQNLFCVVYRSDGALHARTAGLAEDEVPAHVPRSAQDMRTRWVDVERFPGIGRQRIMAERVRLGGQEFIVVLLAPLQAVDDELDRARRVLLTAGPLTLLLSAALGYWLARKALAPMDRLRLATEAMTADRLDQRLAAANAGDELGLLTATINAMIARLERSFAEIRRFTADASHELRTPLTALRAEVEVALGKPLSPAESAEVLGNVLEELVRMSRLTDQLLTLSRRDAGVEQLSLESLDLSSLVAGVVSALGPLAEEKGVRLRFDTAGPIQVAGDAGHLRQVFINLLDNALKYTSRGGNVTVRVGGRGQVGVVTVEDTGIGIPPEHLPHVFERFYRVDKARSRAEGGTGLGLSIARGIVLAHGGTIHLSSTVGQGTLCTVSVGDAQERDNSDSAGPI